MARGGGDLSARWRMKEVLGIGAVLAILIVVHIVGRTREWW